jgi:ankyrin repeat protein
MQKVLLWLLVYLTLAVSGCTRERDADLVQAALNGNVARVQSLMQQGANVEATALDGLTPLDAAAKEGHLEVVKYLVEAGASVNGIDKTDRTALGMAIIYEHVDCAKYLISHGGQVRGTTEWKKGLLESLRKDNQIELYEIARQQLDRANGAI